jgi:carboxymethylenebutenolidase
LEIKEEDVVITTEDGSEIQAFLAQPEEEGKYPGIFLIHEIWGLNEQIKGVARHYAQEGFIVFAPHLFSRYGANLNENNIRKAMGPVFALPQEKRRDPSAMQELMQTLDEDDAEVVRILFAERTSLMQGMATDVQAVFNYFHEISSLNGDKIGVTGFCMGGGLAFQVATQLPFNAAVIFYGANPEPIDSVADLNGPVLIFYAGEDKMVDAGIPALIQAMLENKKTLGLKIYANMQHGFFNEYGSMYNKESAEDAWQLTIAHFNRYLND